MDSPPPSTQEAKCSCSAARSLTHSFAVNTIGFVVANRSQFRLFTWFADEQLQDLMQPTLMLKVIVEVILQHCL